MKGGVLTFSRGCHYKREAQRGLLEFVGLKCLLVITAHYKIAITSEPLWLSLCTLHLTSEEKSKSDMSLSDRLRKPASKMAVFYQSGVCRAIVTQTQTQTKALKWLFTESVLNRMIRTSLIHVFICYRCILITSGLRWKSSSNKSACSWEPLVIRKGHSLALKISTCCWKIDCCWAGFYYGMKVFQSLNLHL